MKHGLVKIWVCSECEKEYIDRPTMCTKCRGLEFYVKYGGLVTDSEELTKLVETYHDDKYEKPAKMQKPVKQEKPAKPEPTEKNKRTRI